MKISAKIFLAMLFLILGCNMEAKEPESSDYMKYVNEVVNGFVNHMKKKYAMDCYGSGGRMPNDIEKIEVLFNSFSKASIDQAREIEVYAVQELLRRINAHEKIRPHLREYPFDTNRVAVIISFRTRTGEWPLDGSVASVFLARNRIFYNKAEIVIREPTPLTYTNKKNKVVTEMVGGGPSEELIPLMDEPFEEAVKIVESTRVPKEQ